MSPKQWGKRKLFEDGAQDGGQVKTKGSLASLFQRTVKQKPATPCLVSAVAKESGEPAEDYAEPSASSDVDVPQPAEDAPSLATRVRSAIPKPSCARPVASTPPVPKPSSAAPPRPSSAAPVPTLPTPPPRPSMARPTQHGADHNANHDESTPPATDDDSTTGSGAKKFLNDFNNKMRSAPAEVADEWKDIKDKLKKKDPSILAVKTQFVSNVVAFARAKLKFTAVPFFRTIPGD